VFVSATPAPYELEKSGGVIVEQVVRPTGLLEPPIEVRPTADQIDDLLEEIQIRVEKDERVLVTTLTKRMAEELDKYLQKMYIRCRYIHSDVDTMERIEIIEDFQAGRFDVLIGVNLLREGLDLPQVSLVAILDADKEGFLRSETALTQTAGRAARNINGLVIMYADTITRSMKRTIDETNRRREKQMEYNRVNGIVPTQVLKKERNVLDRVPAGVGYAEEPEKVNVLQDPVVQNMSKEQLQKAYASAKKEMEKAAAELDFMRAAKFRDEMKYLGELISKK
jgi:excinuclease ABC subunit B